MRLKVAKSIESLSAVTTDMWFLSSMDKFMSFEIAANSKSFVANATFMWFLTSVYQYMCL